MTFHSLKFRRSSINLCASKWCWQPDRSLTKFKKRIQDWSLRRANADNVKITWPTWLIAQYTAAGQTLNSFFKVSFHCLSRPNVQNKVHNLLLLKWSIIEYWIERCTMHCQVEFWIKSDAFFYKKSIIEYWIERRAVYNANWLIWIFLWIRQTFGWKCHKPTIWTNWNHLSNIFLRLVVCVRNFSTFLLITSKQRAS